MEFRWRRQSHPTPILLPRKFHGGRSLAGCSPWGRQSRTRLSDFTFTFHFPALEKEMATHSSVLAWRIPGTGSLVGCRLWGCTESDTTKATQQQQQQYGIQKDGTEESISRARIEPTFPAVEAQHLNHWITKEIPQQYFWLSLLRQGKQSKK